MRYIQVRALLGYIDEQWRATLGATLDVATYDDLTRQLRVELDRRIDALK